MLQLQYPVSYIRNTPRTNCDHVPYVVSTFLRRHHHGKNVVEVSILALVPEIFEKKQVVHSSYCDEGVDTALKQIH
jgi:hypothetical protein